jgi:glycosyltransferase involved in cell wall biosynthesis
MRIAIITACYNTPQLWLDRCRRSVLAQTLPCTHVLVNDGGQSPQLEDGTDVLIAHLPGPHHDTGNAGRAVGSVLAACDGFDAIAYLDSDNWYEPNHLETLVSLQRATGAAVCTSARNLYEPGGTLLGRCPEVDGEKFVDTNCMFLTRAAFGAMSAWYLVPRGEELAADRRVWGTIKAMGLSRAHTGLPTVAYRTSYCFHFEYFGVPPPEGAKVLYWDPVENRMVTRVAGKPRSRE